MVSECRLLSFWLEPANPVTSLCTHIRANSFRWTGQTCRMKISSAVVLILACVVLPQAHRYDLTSPQPSGHRFQAPARRLGYIMLKKTSNFQSIKSYLRQIYSLHMNYVYRRRHLFQIRHFRMVFIKMRPAEACVAGRSVIRSFAEGVRHGSS